MGGPTTPQSTVIRIALAVAFWAWMCTAVAAELGSAIGYVVAFGIMMLGIPLILVGLAPLAPMIPFAATIVAAIKGAKRLLSPGHAISGIHILGATAFMWQSMQAAQRSF